MIIRNIVLRHGRQVIVASASPSCCVRALSTSTAKSATTATAPKGPTNVPSFFTTPEQRAKIAALKEQMDKVPDNFKEFRSIQKKTGKIGAVTQPRHLPDEMLKYPPHDATLEMLMAAQAHMGHNTSLWNPANQRYIYGVREGIHIIALETIAAHLRRAAKVVEEVAYHGGLILFVGTRRDQRPIVVRAAELAGGCHLFQNWTPGTITNRDQILAQGKLRMVDELDRDVPGFDDHIQECRPVIPDLVVCLNPLENYPMLHECGLANVPTIGIIDTNADPTWVTYQIPANDDSLRAMALIAAVLGRAGQRGQERRHADAEDGVITWETPSDVRRFVQNTLTAKAQEKKDQERQSVEQPAWGREMVESDEDVAKAMKQLADEEGI
ncbi:ribosomal protein S2, flavodoxin-like domain-containing protein [Lasiosphaeria hispida]|uniref:Ribosomal protein S2, flavodoxin-like domain-containing protein n=1 Tax=Lasiosphaeria hispida TaxID=260671 RepID=A0AAJ0HDQ4_9PEZI|nr:ribosomal protein S2, flavodoxin-like domain-containing protein [Lasiosphaeria hispida]